MEWFGVHFYEPGGLQGTTREQIMYLRSMRAIYVARLDPAFDPVLTAPKADIIKRIDDRILELVRELLANHERFPKPSSTQSAFHSRLGLRSMTTMQ